MSIHLKTRFWIKNSPIYLLVLVLVLGTLILSAGIENSVRPSTDPVPLEPDGQARINALIINEVMSANDGIYVDLNGKTSDWIELYNGTDRPINLLNFGLSDTLDVTKWLFPEVIIPAKSYLVVPLDPGQWGLVADFSLARDGDETLVLRDAGGIVIDSVTTQPLESNFAMGRDLNGNWVVVERATPGYPNTEAGYTAYLASLVGEAGDLVLSEVLPRNRGNFVLDEGKLPGFIEVTNTGTQSISLKRYALSDDATTPYKWQFPDVTLQGGQSLVVYTGARIADKLSAGFTLEAENGSVLLSSADGKIIDRIDYANLTNGFGLQRVNGVLETSVNVSPGFANNAAGIQAFREQNVPVSTLILNEVMTNNVSVGLHNGSRAYPWIEVMNASAQAINLKDYALNDGDRRSDAVALPDRVLQPGELAVFYLSGDAQLSVKGYTHLDLRLTSDEGLYLWGPDGIVDAVYPGVLGIDQSYGRNAQKAWVYLATSSLGQSNGSGRFAISVAPTTLVVEGRYRLNQLEVKFSSGSTVHYTTDGSTPTSNSPIYSKPITITKTTVIKAISTGVGQWESPVQHFTYLLNDVHDINVVSLTVDPAQFTYLTTHPSSTTLEVPAKITYFDQDGPGFSLEAGLQLFGGQTRYLSKKSFAIKFKGKYGASKLAYPLFDYRDYAVFDSLILRSGSQDYYTTVIRDILGLDMMESSETVLVQAYESVVLYINGKYWGLYDIREQIDENMVSSQLNIPAENINIVRIDNVVTSGTIGKYRQMMTMAKTLDLSQEKNYREMEKILNIDSYIDYWLAEMMCANNDTINTRYFWSEDYDNGRINLFFYDLDYAWYWPNKNYYDHMTNPEGMSTLKVTTALARGLVKSPLFRQRLVERLSEFLKTQWTTDLALQRLDAHVERLLPEVERDWDRWGLDFDEYDDNIDYLRNFILKRTDMVLKHTKAYFDLSDAEFEEYFGDLP